MPILSPGPTGPVLKVETSDCKAGDGSVLPDNGILGTGLSYLNVRLHIEYESRMYCIC